MFRKVRSLGGLRDGAAAAAVASCPGVLCPVRSGAWKGGKALFARRGVRSQRKAVCSSRMTGGGVPWRVWGVVCAGAFARAHSTGSGLSPPPLGYPRRQVAGRPGRPCRDLDPSPPPRQSRLTAVRSERAGR